MTRFLAVDVGNTRAKFGVFELALTGTALPSQPRPIAMSATPLSNEGPLAVRLQTWLKSHRFADIEACVIAGSNPPQLDSLLNDLPSVAKTVVRIDHYKKVPIPLDVDDPAAVGIDRLLTAYAARQLVTSSKPLIVIDSGTATTVNLTTSDGTFRGGAIFPGLRLSAYAMHDYTARLPLIETDTLTNDDTPEIAIEVTGRNTTDAMKAGLFWGQLGAVKEIAARLGHQAATKFDETKQAQLVLTGGGGRQLVSQLSNAIFIDCLALHGLAIILATTRYDQS